MKEDTHLPASVRFSRQASWKGWIAIKSLNPRGLDNQLRTVGWTFHLLAGTIQKTAFGFDAETRFDRALGRAIKFVQAENCNCVEFDQMTEKSIFGLPYTSVSVHSRHIQEGLLLNNRQHAH